MATEASARLVGVRAASPRLPPHPRTVQCKAQANKRSQSNKAGGHPKVDYLEPPEDEWPSVLPEVTLLDGDTTDDLVTETLTWLKDEKSPTPEAMLSRVQEVEDWAQKRDRDRQRALAVLQAASEKRAQSDNEREAKAQARIEELCKEIETLKAAQTEKASNKEVKKLKEVVETLTAEKTTLTAELERVDALRQDFTRRHETMKSVVEARTASLQAARDDLDRVTEAYNKKAEYAEQLEGQVVALKGQRENLTEIAREFDTQNTELEEELYKKGVELIELKKALEAEMGRLNLQISEQSHLFQEAQQAHEESRALAASNILTLKDTIANLTAELDEALETAVRHAENAEASTVLSQQMEKHLELTNRQLEEQEAQIEALNAQVTHLQSVEGDLGVARGRIAALEDNLEWEKADKAQIRGELEFQISEWHNDMEQTKTKIEAMTSQMAAEVQAAMDTQRRCEQEREAMNVQAAALQEAAVASVTEASADKASVIGSASDDVTAAVNLMGKHMDNLREMSAGTATGADGAIIFRDPVDTLRASLGAAEIVYKDLLNLQECFIGHKQKAAEESAKKAALRDIEVVMHELRQLRNETNENENLTKQVHELKTTLASLNILLSDN